MTVLAKLREVHPVSKILDLSFEALLNEPVVIEEALFKQFITPFPSTEEEDFLNLSFESLFQVRLDPLLKDTDKEAEEQDVTQTLLRAGSSFLEVEIVSERIISERLIEPSEEKGKEPEIEEEEIEEEVLEEDEFIPEVVLPNEPPVAQNDFFVTDEDTAFITGNVLTNDSDPNPGDVLSVLNSDTTLTKGVVTDWGDGTFRYNPNGQFDFLHEGDVGFDTFSYVATDGDLSSAPAIVTVAIQGRCELAVNTFLDDGSGGTLRDLIRCANENPGEDTIQLQAGTYHLSILGAGEDLGVTGDFDILDDLIIKGAPGGGTIIDANEIDRVFDMVDGNLTLEDVTIRDGNVLTGDGGGILNRGHALNLTDVVIRENSAETGYGGGLYQEAGSVLISLNSDFIRNFSDAGGGAVYNNGVMHVSSSTFGDINFTNSDGGAIENNGLAFIFFSTFESNLATTGQGAAIKNNTTGNLLIENSTIIDNFSASGAGLYNEGNATVQYSTIFLNWAQIGGGGAIYNQAGTLIIFNSTISNNFAQTGAGIENDSGGSIELSNTTITQNLIDSGDVFAQGAGITNNLDSSESIVTLTSTIIAENSSAFLPYRDLSGDGFTSLGHNLIGNDFGTIGNPFENGVNDDIVGDGGEFNVEDPELDDLENNGGPTQTHALLVTSPAIDAGEPHPGPLFQNDQRGFGFFNQADIGAFEFNGIPSVVLDLDGDGIELVSPEVSGVFLAVFGGADFYQIGWVGPDDGILVYDVNQDGLVTSREEFVLSDYHEEAKTDLEGLALAFDSNQDGVFDISDEHYIDFGVWQDADQDGVSDTGEFHSLESLDIASVDLQSDSTAQILEGNIVYGTTHYTLYDGTELEVGDVALSVGSKFEGMIISEAEVLVEDEDILNLLLEIGLGAQAVNTVLADSNITMLYADASAIPIFEVAELMHQVDQMSLDLPDAQYT